MIKMASLTEMAKVIVVSTLVFSGFRCDADTQNLQNILRRVEDARENNKQSATDVRYVPSRDNSFNEMSKSLLRDSGDDELWKAIGELSKQISDLQNNVENQQTEINQVKNDVDEMETDVQQLEAKTESLDGISNEHQDELVKLKDESSQHHAKFTKIAQGSLGFEAYDTHESSMYSDRDVLQFDTVHYNSGNHFDTNSGKFTCPYHGVYQFGVNISPFFNFLSGVVFSVDGVQFNPFLVQGIYEVSDTDLISMDKTTSITVIECKAGQKIWLEARFSAFLSSGFFGYSTFSGVLINRLDL